MQRTLPACSPHGQPGFGTAEQGTGNDDAKTRRRVECGGKGRPAGADRHAAIGRSIGFDPATRGAEITARNFEGAKYDGNYRISANFLNWLVQKHGPETLVKLNAAAREGRYREDLWKELTGKTVQELGDAWREEHRVRLGLPAPKTE